jgi:hypothetical protein
VTTLSYAERAARLLRAARARIRPHRSAASGETIALLTAAIAAAATRRLRRRVTAAAGAATAVVAAVALMVSGPWSSPKPAGRPDHDLPLAARPSLVTGGQSAGSMTTAGGGAEPLAPGHGWIPDERLQTDVLPVTLAAADGTTIALQPRSDLKLLRADAERWMRLGSGAVSVHVAKLTTGERFVILTPDTQVEVRGTRFHVALVPPAGDCGHGTPTRVVVDEGVVVVRSSQGEVRVTAGASWPTGCAPSRGASSSSPSIRPPTQTKRPPQAAPSMKAAPPTDTSVREEVAPSTLATENDLFSAALKAERSGDRRTAAHLLDVLVARFPKSPLRESAERESARLTGVGPTSP